MLAKLKCQFMGILDIIPRYTTLMRTKPIITLPTIVEVKRDLLMNKKLGLRMRVAYLVIKKLVIKSRISVAQGKTITFYEEWPTKMDAEDKKRQHHDLELVEPLSIDDEDFSKLLEIGRLEFSNESLDKRVHLCTMIKYHEIEKLDNMTVES